VFGFLTVACSLAQAQPWEFGAGFGFGTSHDPNISSPTASAQSDFRTKAALSVIWAENPYQYLGGEFRYTFRWGGPKLTANGTQASMDGYANVLTYDILIHMKPRESRVRPYIAGGAGIKIYTASSQEFANQPLSDIALLRPGTQVEPVISAGGGIKYLLTTGLQLRVDFRTHMTPLPNDLIHPVGKSVIHGWTYDFLPMLGVSYVF
jgi:hypothetical protein